MFYALFDAIGLPGNLLVIVTIALERRFYVLRYILLASLAVSDFLLLILVNSFRIKSIAQERWIYGETMCQLNSYFVRYFYFNTVLHLIAVSYERYKAIVKSPLTYDGRITTSRVVFIILIWVIPIPLSIGPLISFAGGRYVYNPAVFYCEQGWALQTDSVARNTIILAIVSFAVPLLVIVFLNWSIYKTAKNQINAIVIQLRTLDGAEAAESQQQDEMSRRKREREAAVDVIIIIAAFLLCFLPSWIVGICRQFLRSTDVPAKTILVTSAISFLSSLCNPIIYSIRKKKFRTAIKKIIRRIVELCGNCRTSQINVIGIDNLRFNANLDTEASNPAPAAVFATRNQIERYNGKWEEHK